LIVVSSLKSISFRIVGSEDLLANLVVGQVIKFQVLHMVPNLPLR
jgi:hypothetical protein